MSGNQDVARVNEQLNRAVSHLLSVDPTDLTGLTSTMSLLQGIADNGPGPKAFRNMASRGARLTEHIIMNETPFEQGCERLGECLEKMLRSINAFANEPTEGSDGGDQNAESADREMPEVQEQATIPDDLRELALKFAAQELPVLDDLEAYILEWEKGQPQAKGAVRRILHTLKGEFGVLDLQDYSELIHRAEDCIERGVAATEELLRLKDLLASKMEQFTMGSIPALTKSETEGLFSETGQSPQNSPVTDIIDEKAEARDEPDAAVEQQPVPEPPQEDASQCAAADPSLLKDFVTESMDHIRTIEPLLLDLENDPGNPEHLNSIFRACHTIKGVSGFLGLKEINTLAHSMENVMDMARREELLLEPAHIDLLLEAMDCLKELVVRVEGLLSGQPFVAPEGYASIMDRLSAPKALRGPESQGTPVGPDKKVGEILVESGGATPEEVKKALDDQAKGDQRRLGEILIEKKAAPARDVGKALAAQNAARKSGTVEETIRVPVERLDQLVDAIGEAVIAQSMIAADPTITGLRDQGLERKITQTNLIMRQIQELSMSLRMVSIKSTFQKMARLVRDLSKKSGKEVDLVLEGEETELDKSVVENIGDPLIHMIRNAIDHGIESSTEERKDRGKSPRACVSLRAFHRSGNIYVEVADDGRGLDKDRILEKARKQGLCRPEEKLSDQEIYQFIFHPGFSTAQKVTDVSGRGVGMDVVKRNIQQLRGSIEIQTEKGKGTTFSIRLPLTLAIIDGMIARLKDETYIVPTLSIIESLKPTHSQIETVLEKGEVVKVRGELIPFIRLSGVFGKNGNGKRTDATQGIVIIVEDMLGKRVGLLVDEILGQQQVVIKSLGRTFGDVAGVAGGAIMSDGNVSLILDIGGLVRMAAE